MSKRHHHPLIATTAIGLFTATFGLGRPSVATAQDNPPPPAPAADRALPRPPGPGPRGDRPPGPEADQSPAQPVDPKAAPVAVKTADATLAGLTAGQVWARTAPRGEQEVRASLVFNGKEVACLDFDPATGSLRARGEGRPLPPVPPAPAPATPANLDPVKTKLADILKGLSIGQGAEIMPREGFWKVPLIFQNRVVGELHVSGDGTKVMEDFAAARDAAIFAR